MYWPGKLALLLVISYICLCCVECRPYMARCGHDHGPIDLLSVHRRYVHIGSFCASQNGQSYPVKQVFNEGSSAPFEMHFVNTLWQSVDKVQLKRGLYYPYIILIDIFSVNIRDNCWQRIAQKSIQWYYFKMWRHSELCDEFRLCRSRCYLALVDCATQENFTGTGAHDDVIKWKHFPCYWPFVRGIHGSPVKSPHKGQWRGALMFSFFCA